MIPWLDDDTPFPPLDTALSEPNGLLVAGGDLTPQRILSAYRQGIFPWFSPGDPILWWSPDPRMVLFPDEFRLSRSLRKRLKRSDFIVSINLAFESVMRACATTPRPGQNGTWITQEMLNAYVTLHKSGHAHSVECWDSATGHLVGGLYGVSIGKMFYGESMFSHATDASKAAFAHLIAVLQSQNAPIIDCQMKTDHLTSLGGRDIPRAEFTGHLTCATAQSPLQWPHGPLALHW